MQSESGRDTGNYMAGGQPGGSELVSLVKRSFQAIASPSSPSGA